MLMLVGGILLVAGAVILLVNMVKREENSWPTVSEVPVGRKVAEMIISSVGHLCGILLIVASISFTAADKPGLQACLYSPSGELLSVHAAPCAGVKAPWDRVSYRYAVAYPERHVLVADDGMQYSVDIGTKYNWRVYIAQASLDGRDAKQYAAENIYPVAYQIIRADLASRAENGESLQHDLDVDITLPLASVLDRYDSGAVTVQDANVHLTYLGKADDSKEVSQTWVDAAGVVQNEKGEKEE